MLSTQSIATRFSPALNMIMESLPLVSSTRLDPRKHSQLFLEYVMLFPAIFQLHPRLYRITGLLRKLSTAPGTDSGACT
jgi:hypothetical protein